MPLGPSARGPAPRLRLRKTPTRGTLLTEAFGSIGCIDAIAEPSAFSMRSCLETRHDRLMRELNVDYWNANVGS